MRTRSVMGALLLVCGFAAACSHKDGDTNNITGPSNPTPTISISATPNMLAMVTDSTKVTVTWNAANVTSCSATWTTSTATSGTAVVVPTVSGIAQQNVGYPMTCTGPNGTVQNAAAVTVLGRATYSATGTIHLANAQPGESPAGWPMKMVIGTDSVIGKVDALGNYVLVDTMSTQNAPASTANTMITLMPPSDSRYTVSYSSLTASASSSLPWVINPKSWAKEAGCSAGKIFPVGPDSLMSFPGPGDSLHFLKVSRVSNATQGTVGSYVFSTWSPKDLPIKWAFDRTRSTSPLTAHDSVNFQMKVDTLNTCAGQKFIVPANYSDIGPTGKGILVFVDSLQVTQKFGADQTGAAGSATPAFDADGNIVHVDIRIAYEAYFGDQYANVGLFEHELLHALGEGHSPCGSLRWNSVMAGTDFTACPVDPNQTQVAADLDLVYLEMMYEVKSLQVMYNTKIGFAEWLNGSLVAQGKAPSTNAILP